MICQEANNERVTDSPSSALIRTKTQGYSKEGIKKTCERRKLCLYRAYSSVWVQTCHAASFLEAELFQASKKKNSAWYEEE